MLKHLNPLRLFDLLITMFMFYVIDEVESTVITNADATPVTINKAQLARGRVFHARGKCTLATAAAEATSQLKFFRIKSNDLVSSLILDAESFGTGCTMDIGLYRTEADGGAVVDIDFFASAVDMATAQRGTDVTREANANNAVIANMEKCVWEALGLSVDPQVDYDVVGTLAVAATVAGTAVLVGSIVGRT